MNLKHMTIGVAAVFVLAGCNTTNKDAEGVKDTGIEQTRYNNDMNGMDDRIGMNDNGTINDGNMVPDRNDGTVNDNKINSGTMNDGNMHNNQDKKYNTSEKAAEKITADIPEIKRAHVLMTDNNAYVVATFDKMANDTGNNDALLTDEVKKKVSKVVKSTEKNIDNVYVTTNPDFANLVGNYADDVKNGKPIGGFFDQVGNMIERVFPQDKR